MKYVVPFHRGESSFEASARAEYVDIDMAWTMRVFESLCWLQKGRIFHSLQLGLAQVRVQNPMSPCQLVALRVLCRTAVDDSLSPAYIDNFSCP